MRKILALLLGVIVFSTYLNAQTRSITGTILDNNGQPLPGVSVRVVGDRTGTTTDAQGVFTLTVPSTATLLEITSVGYVLQRVAIPATGQVTITMEPTDATSLNEVVVTGYTRQRRAEYSGAGSKVQAEQVNLVPMGSIDQILQGRSPGLLVTAGSGQPGAAARVQIRGAGSISGGNTPLYVIDGVPVEAGVFQSINPNDIESVDVLRDASATAQYGNRGASGVIVVTTKKGRAGQTVLGYSGQAGFTQTGVQRFDMMNSNELLDYQETLGTFLPTITLPGWRYSRQNPANANLPAGTLDQYDKTLDSLRSIDTDWRDVFFRQGSFQSHDINLSGGAGKTRFFTSLGLYDEEGIALRSDMKRYSFRSNIDHQTDKLTIALNAFAGYTKRNFIESENSVTLANPFAAAYLALPYHDLNAYGFYHQLNNNGRARDGLVGPNAYARIFETESGNNQLKSNVSVNANYQLTQNFNLGAFAGLDFRETINERLVRPYTWSSRAAGFPVGPRQTAAQGTDTLARGSFNENVNRFFSYITRGNLGYRNLFGDVHDIDVQTFVEYTKDKNRSFTYTGFGINEALMGSPAAITPGNTTNQLIPTVGGGRTERALFGILGTARYTYDKKYTFNLSLRRDGTSQLPEANRFNTFYSIGATWNVLRESFASNLKVFNDLRFRASYGTSATADNFFFGNFGYLPAFAPVNYIGAGTVQGTIPTNAGNPDVIWEQVATLNLGIDFGMLRNRLSGSLDVYRKTTEENIISQNLSLTSGFRSQFVNAGDIRNQGVELQLTGDVIKSRNFNWTVGGNISYNHNEVISLNQVNEFEQGTSIIRVGLPLGTHYLVKWAGVDAATGQPLYYTKDGTLTNVYSDDDRVAEFGTYNAPWIGGFNTGINFKGFAIDAFFTFQEGFSRFNNQDFFQLNHAFALQGFNLRREMFNTWNKPGDVTNIQSPLYQRQFTSKDIQDASYLRFRNLNVSYTVGENIVSRLKILNSVRFFLQGQNLYTWTSWTAFDPEDNNNIAQYEYPTPRTFTAGVNLNFR